MTRAVVALLASGLWAQVRGQTLWREPVELRMLLLAASGSEPSFAAARAVLDQMGTPYDAVVLGKGDPLPSLEESGVGRYQGIILSTGNLGICDPDCRSALSKQGWDELDRYAVRYGVRTLSYYTFPEARYGLEAVGNLPASAAETEVRVLAEGESLFPYLRTERPVKVRHAFTWLAKLARESKEAATPILKIGEDVGGVIYRAPDGRESLAVTMDQSPVLEHSALLSYGLVRWVARGVFLGYRRAYLNPQVDDLFLANEQFDGTQEACVPKQLTLTAILNPNSPCPRLRIVETDLDFLAAWQDEWNRHPQLGRLKISLAYNGFGTNEANDPLVLAAQRYADRFYWINHTYNHKNLDCYTAEGNGCRGANAEEATVEIVSNLKRAAELGLTADPRSVVTPGISGLRNQEFLRAAADRGVEYLVSDTSQREYEPRLPNSAIRSPLEPRILLIPRRATGLFYNASRPEVGAVGSETDEYNLLFGPAGILKLNGLPFFEVDQTYDDIVERESDTLLACLLRGEIYPTMFHQGNLNQHAAGASLMTDVLDAALRKFVARVKLPVESRTQSEVGAILAGRLKTAEVKVKAVWRPEQGVKLETDSEVEVWVTGACGEECEEYAADKQWRLRLKGGEPVTAWPR
ncbi:MAG: hypothetical protein JNN08_15195 [Bryobacterales bacterium]|nr:hypothetical protein [Bryobacterales bacterium]